MQETYSVEGMTCQGCVAKVKYLLEGHEAISSADISLENGSATLTQDRALTAGELQALLGNDGKYLISPAATVTPAASALEQEEQKSWLATYKPLLIIFLFITGITGIIAWEGNGLNYMAWMQYFMAGFFLVFSFFKMLDVKAFASSYQMYDLLAAKVKAWGYIYPFVELALGLAYLTGFDPVITNTATLVIMGFSSLGVIQSVLDKRKIRCACLGSVFNLPMSTVTIVEDLLMVAMAGAMLFFQS